MKIPGDIRRDIPLTGSHIYFDSAASSLTPRPVVEAMDEYYLSYRANVHRGLHKLSEAASRAYEKSRARSAAFIGARPEEIIFTSGATFALNMVAASIPEKGDIVLTTELEHHSNYLPWLRLRERGIEVRLVGVTSQGSLDLEDLASKMKGARILSISHTSNLLGTITPLHEVRKLTEEEGVLLCVDAAQAVGHAPVDVKRLGCDFLAFSGHKGPMGPTGIGILFAREEHHETMQPTFLGGGMVEDVTADSFRMVPPPERFEAGTPNIAGAIGLSAALDYIEKVGLERIEEYERTLTSHTLNRFSEIDGLVVYGPSGRRAAIIPFNLPPLSSHEVALILDEAGICVRSGQHCAIPPLRAIGTDEVVRASYHCYNTTQEIDKMADVLEDVSRNVL